ncbi:MAG: hypothetical protein ACLUQW_05735 [Collinsella sp.]
MPGVTPAEVLSNFGITLVEDPAENQPRLLVDLPAAELSSTLFVAKRAVWLLMARS